MREHIGALIDEGQREFEAGLEATRIAVEGMSRHNAYLGLVKGLVTEEGMVREQLASLLAFATLLLLDERAVVANTIDSWDAMSEMRAERERYRLAWRSARQRARDAQDALVEADEERDFLRARLRDRDDEVAELVVRLADYSGVTS